ncbi:uncharacterized protein LOC113295828 isoform X2 [Papaver somniferum]|uniref:uncharacterized protein LOC113295828 isoform X2 n=1 Tax=Papaver somniferum TaxID=3469 RepID=UPI000E6FE139|nr:uncharacterized protein LOC113295828 isoform X2 [Papaver somniferum]
MVYVLIILSLDGVLYYSIFYFSGGKRSDVWLLKVKKDIGKEQVEHESLGWSKALTLPGKEPLAFTKSGGLLCYAYSSLNIYDATTSTSKKLMGFGDAISQIFSHKNTLVSVKELGEADIRLMESAETEETDKAASNMRSLDTLINCAVSRRYTSGFVVRCS